MKQVPAKVSIRLHSFAKSTYFDVDFNYRSVVRKLDYLGQVTSSWQCIRLPSTLVILGRSMEKQSYILWCTSRAPVTLAYILSLIHQRALKTIVMPTSQEIGTRNLPTMISLRQSQGLAGASFTLAAPSLQGPSSNLKLHSQPLRQSTSHCHSPYMIWCPSWSW